MQVPVRPSNVNRWYHCTASVKMTQRYPELPQVDNTIRDEGLAFHWLVEQMLMNAVDKSIIGNDYNNVTITQEMYDHAVKSIDIISEYTETVFDINIEQELKLDNIYPGMTGRPDVWFYDFYNDTLHVFDFKYGFIKASILQLVMYASVLIEKKCNVVLHIIQPRIPEIHQIHKTNSDDIIKLTKQISEKAFETMSENTVCKVGNYCIYCSARIACKALQESVLTSIEISYGGDIGVNELPLKILAQEYELIQYAKNLMNYRLSAIEDKLIHEIKSGERINGYTLVPKCGRKKWKNDINIDNIVKIGEMMGVDLTKPKSLITPTQAEKKLKNEKIIEEYIETPQHGYKLKKIDKDEIRRIFT